MSGWVGVCVVCVCVCVCVGVGVCVCVCLSECRSVRILRAHFRTNMKEHTITDTPTAIKAAQAVSKTASPTDHTHNSCIIYETIRLPTLLCICSGHSLYA